jgi:hypothetical protein
MRKFLSLSIFMLLLGCSETPKQMLETARFEEKQGNRPHAAQLYGEIVARHPASPEAREAELRLKELQPR